MEYFDLPDNVIFKIREDNIGRVWFFSHTGKLSYFYNEAIHPYAYNDSITKYCKNLLITDAYVKDNGDIIINSGRFENYKISAKGIVEHVNLYDIEPNAHARIRIDQIGKNIFFSQKEKFHRDHSENKIIDIVRVVNGHKVICQVPVRPEEFSHHGCVSADGKTIYYFLARNLVGLN